jgi:2-phosphosulfolactate phosphatase
VALHRVRRAKRVYIGALLNLDALAQILERENSTNLLLVCAGTGEEFAIEDAIAAGGIVDRLSSESLSDAAVLVKSLYREAGSDIFTSLSQSKNGRALLGIGKLQDVQECARVAVSQTIGVMQDEAVVKLSS